MVEESGRPIAHVARDLGITSEVLRKRVCQAEADRGERPAMLSSSEREELRALRREVTGPRRANAILKDATACFAAELDPTRQQGNQPGEPPLNLGRFRQLCVAGAAPKP
jgi:transposase